MIRNVEFYNTPDGAVMVKKVGEQVKELLPTDVEFIHELFELILDSFPESEAKIENLYNQSKPNRSFFEYRIVDRFCRCNFGKYDQSTLDVDEHGMINVEEVDCPLRNTNDCKFCGIICKPKRSTVLTERELTIARLVAEGLSNDVIADRLAISALTVISHRRHIRSKINASNTPDMLTKLKGIL